ncbi:tetratricopeptide repeat protein, partial [Candidatus Bipolaricaulota bacterium]|nr:tetratricopeptide repeat protein [Candidatus Bipolaricaulota bacterium]
LRIIAQTSTMAYKGTTKTIREIGRELKVGSILEGSVRKSGDRVRTTTHLIDVQSEEHLWYERYDRELADVFEIQSEISAEVGKGLKMLLKNERAAKIIERPTDQLDAYTEYLKGRHYWNRRTKSGLLQALDHFNQAIKVDPGFARAHSGIADCYSVLANHGYSTNEDALPKAKDAAKRALALDPNLAEAHASLGIAYLQFKLDAVAAEKEFKEAIRLNPSYATARQWYSGALHAQLRLEEALEHAQMAIGLDPLAHIMHINAATILSSLGRHEDAREHFRRAIELEPDYEATYAELARADMTLWNWRGAKETLADALERHPRNTIALACKASLVATFGNMERALETIEEALEIEPESGLLKDQKAQILRLAGHHDEAIAIFEAQRQCKDCKPWSAIFHCLAYIDIGRYEDARRVLREDEDRGSTSLPGMGFWFDTLRGMVAAAEGSADEARSYLEKVSRHEVSSEIHTGQAMILFLLGEADPAYAHLEEAMARHERLLIIVPVDPLFASQHADPRFQRMLEVMGLAKVGSSV